MVDAALVQQCTDPTLNPAIVERFIEKAGSPNPLSVTVRSGERIILVPPAKTPDAAMALIRQHVGRSTVRVGITQYPAGLGIKDPSELKPDLVDACENIRMGTALFGKVYRIVTKWYGNPVEEAFDDAIIAWQTGYFEGTAVFREPDPDDIKVAAPITETSTDERQAAPVLTEEETDDPNKAAIRIDLSGIGAGKR